MRATQGVGLAVTVLLLGCASDVVDSGEGRLRGSVPLPSFTTTRKCNESQGANPNNFTDYWSCKDTIWMDLSGLPTSPDYRGDATSAVNDWNNALTAASLQIPYLKVNGGPPYHRIAAVLQSSGSQYCGQVIISGKPITINMSAGNCGTFRNVFLHELSHVYGFQDAWEKDGIAGFSNHCARFLPAGKATNTSVCQHEVETLHKKYGIRSAPAVSLSKHVMTGLGGLPASITMLVGETRNLTVNSFVFNRVNPACSTCEDMTPSGSASWSESSSAISVTGSAQFTRTVHADALGSGTITVQPTGATFELAGYFTNDTVKVTVTSPPPPPPPTGLSASNVTATSALVSWTPGDIAAATVLRYRMTGQKAWTTANGGAPVPAGQSSFTLSGLHCATSYDASVYHTKGGAVSPELTLTLFSTGACQIDGTVVAPTNFVQSNCTASQAGGKNYATYDLAWTAGSNPAAAIYQIGHALTSNSASAVVIRTGRIITMTDAVGPYLVTPTSTPRYFWVRHANGAKASVWVALQGNPIQIKDGCLL